MGKEFSHRLEKPPELREQFVAQLEQRRTDAWHIG